MAPRQAVTDRSEAQSWCNRLVPVACFFSGMVVFAMFSSVPMPTGMLLRNEGSENAKNDFPCSNPRLMASLPSPAVLAKAMSEFVATKPKEGDNYAGPALFDCASIERYGGDPKKNGDGGKWICGLRDLRAPCTVYSLGSDLDFSFEALISEMTPCDIVTADCTVEAAAAEKLLPPRTRFFPFCLGSVDGHGMLAPWRDLPARESTQFVTLPTLLRKAGHVSIDLLKVCKSAPKYELLSEDEGCALPFVDGHRRWRKRCHRKPVSIAASVTSPIPNHCRDTWRECSRQFQPSNGPTRVCCCEERSKHIW